MKHPALVCAFSAAVSMGLGGGSSYAANSPGQAGAHALVAQEQSLTAQKPAESATLTNGSPDGRKLEQGLHSVLGIEVHTLTDKHIGRIVDLLADRNGVIQAAVIEFGGFLGLGTRKVAVDWSALRFEKSGKEPVATAEITREQLRLAPENKPGEPAVVLKAYSALPSTDDR
jgi:PRC-barrel domain protein